jgi:hypothetical protein
MLSMFFDEICGKVVIGFASGTEDWAFQYLTALFELQAKYVSETILRLLKLQLHHQRCCSKLESFYIKQIISF